MRVIALGGLKSLISGRSRRFYVGATAVVLIIAPVTYLGAAQSSAASGNCWFDPSTDHILPPGHYFQNPKQPLVPWKCPDHIPTYPAPLPAPAPAPKPVPDNCYYKDLYTRVCPSKPAPLPAPAPAPANNPPHRTATTFRPTTTTIPLMTIKGRVTVGGVGRDGLTIETCAAGKVLTRDGGYYSFSVRRGNQFCARLESAVPSWVPTAFTRNNAEVANISAYEYQVAGVSCYHVAMCGTNPSVYDRNTDSGYDFVITNYRSISANGNAGYKINSWGAVESFNGAAAASGSPSWRGWDIARAVALIPGSNKGYVLDGFGGLHGINGAPAATGATYWKDWDIARDVKMTGVGNAGYVLDGWGGVHPFNGAPAVQASGYWKNWDIAKKLVVLPNNAGGYVLDGFGGIHPFTVIGKKAPAAPKGATYWNGWDIARSIVVNPNGTGGYVLDGWGGTHPFAIGNNPVPPQLKGPYWKNADIATDLVITNWSTYSGYVLDGTGGVHPLSR